MQRRVVLELSRRQDVANLSFAAAHRITPTNYGLRRTFHSSPIALDSLGSNNDGKDGSKPRPSFSPPKFTSRWGSGQSTQRPVALSPAEQAIRDKMRAQQPKKEEDKKEQETTRPRINDSPIQKRPWGGARQSITLSPAEQTMRERMAAQRKQREQGNSDTRGAGPRDQRQRLTHRPVYSKDAGAGADKPRKHFKSDWHCPNCGFNCFGKYSFCPRCSCPGPEPETDPSRPRRVKEVRHRANAEQAAARRSKKYSAWSEDIGDLLGGENAGEPISKTDDVVAVDPIEEIDREKLAELQSQDIEENQQDSRQWGLEEEEEEQVIQRRKDYKRRDGRKQRKNNEEEEGYDQEETRRRREDRKRAKKERTRRKEVHVAPSPIFLPEFISVSNLADVIGVRPAQFVQRMEQMGFEGVTYSHVLDAETAGLIAIEYNFEPIFDQPEEGFDLTAAPEPEDPSSLPPRPPVVTIMGHVDHGKTTILDWLRKSSIAAGEHGGITQHIGAFSVAMPSGQTITFLDTPGHAAFLEMRRRGADVTDIVVLVVAADDSVKPQTIEAIRHATGAKVPIVVAISKIDKEDINVDKVKQDLAANNVYVEEYGGDVQAIGVSGKTGLGMVELEEAILALSDMQDHRADTEGNVEGWVIESTTKSYGRVTTALVKRGTLRVGDIVVAGDAWARVRTLRNEAGVTINEATPGMPVEIDGWREQPNAGTEMIQAPSEQRAKDVVEWRLEQAETQKLGEDATAINEARRGLLDKRRQEELEQAGHHAEVEQSISGPKPVHFIIKADVDGSVEAVLNSVTAIGNNEVYPNVLRSAVGPVGEFDIEHAAAAHGNIITFNTTVDHAMLRMAEQRGVRIMDHNVIYKLMDDVKEILSEQLPPNVTQRVTGEAEISQVFDITVKKRETTAIAGCRVRNGIIQKTKKVRVLRGQDIIYDGSMTSLKNVKKDVVEMRKDTECGISFEGWTEFAPGDHVQCYEDIYEKRYL
ncbi:translation initiation factor 2 [Aspergillus ruber CBS 135680]|uniref:Translation initiation factor IF-2, mitochondrial n=1 Tax=Aspergillus ruber (strain CBS 135680) TaxID=1388766 RepID=A0A017SS41_ASPRC|nr:initiation factor 2 [Aspergillus ruber CBS 135680]EYE99414.1 initiation factor 2 [Aspergillus ruber CBS 135680]